MYFSGWPVLFGEWWGQGWSKLASPLPSVTHQPQGLLSGWLIFSRTARQAQRHGSCAACDTCWFRSAAVTPPDHNPAQRRGRKGRGREERRRRRDTEREMGEEKRMRVNEEKLKRMIDIERKMGERKEGGCGGRRMYVYAVEEKEEQREDRPGGQEREGDNVLNRGEN